MGLIERLPAGPVALDTAPFIYFIEDHPRFAPLLTPLFETADRGERTLVTSDLTLLEVLVVPYRLGDEALGERYDALLTRGRGLDLVPVDRRLLRAAARLRALHGVGTPDAIQLAAALRGRSSSFVTNDRRLPALPGLEIVQLNDIPHTARRGPGGA